MQTKALLWQNYNAYDLAENIHGFRLGKNHTQTFYAVDAGNTAEGNVYGTVPFYQETRYDGKRNGIYCSWHVRSQP